MSILNKIFDKIYVINLERDSFKKAMIIKKFSNLKINFEFINAVNGHDEPYISNYKEYRSKPYDWDGAHEYEIKRKAKMIPSPGAYGYIASWIKVIKQAIKNNANKILVFDDDVIFHDNFENEVRLFFNTIGTKFKIISLGVSQHSWSKIIKKHRYYNPIEHTDGSFALGIDSSIFQEILDDASKYNIALDSGAIRNIYKKYQDECFVAYPNLVIADLTSSSISAKRDMNKLSEKFNWDLTNFNYIPYCNILVSIILTVYNAKDTIALAIESIIKQTYNNIELIIIDDASTDNTLNIIKATINKFKNYKIFNEIKVIELKKNMGCYFAKNIGLRLCKGEIIGFQDADDISLLNRIELQAKEIIDNDYEIVGSEIIRCSESIKNLNNLNENVQKELSLKNPNRFGLITLMFKKDVFKTNGFYRDYFPHSMDQEFIERIYFNKIGKLSDTHCHTLLCKNQFPDYKKVNKTLYLCQPVNSTNISTTYNKGHKNYVRKIYLEDIENRENIDYILSFRLISFIYETFGKIIVNDEINLNYLKYFVNDEKSEILEINPAKETNNYILLTKLQYFNINKNSKKIITTNPEIFDKLESEPLFYKIFESYKEKVEREKKEENIKKENEEKAKLEQLKNLKDGKKSIIEKINKKKNSNLIEFLEDNNITQVLVSNVLPNINFEINKNYKYKNLNENTLFYGIYTYKDYNNVKKHDGKKWILWAGNDCNPIYNRRIHVVISVNELNIQKNVCFNNHVNHYLKDINIDYYNIDEKKMILSNNIQFQPIKNKKFVFIIPSYNNENYYKKNLDSVLNQTYNNWKIIYVDDFSTDKTYELVEKYIKDNKLDDKFMLIKNDKNMKQAYSRYQCYKYCNDDDIICFLDGDDWLYDKYVLEKLNKEYDDDIMITYGTYCNFEDGKLGSIRKPPKYKSRSINFGSYRTCKGWYGVPLRTGYAKIYKEMPESYMFDNDGNWMSACTDVAEFLWAIEKSLKKFKVIEYPTYVYNIDASKRFKNSMYNLSNEQFKYRHQTSEKIFNTII
jgi:glycosyltransferase involved in cell wall biosynthesis